MQRIAQNPEGKKILLVGPIGKEKGGTRVSFKETVDYCLRHQMSIDLIDTTAGDQGFSRLQLFFRIFLDVFKKLNRGDLIYLNMSPIGMAGAFIPIFLIAKMRHCEIWLKWFGGDLDIFWQQKLLFRPMIYLALVASGKSFLQTKYLTHYFSKFSSVQWLPNSRSIGNVYDIKEALTVEQVETLKNNNIAIFVGSISEQKGYYDLISLAQELPPNWKIVLIGHVSSEICEPQFGQDVLFFGHIPNRFLPTVLSSCNLFLFPSRYPGEGHPGAVIEAMFNGLPVLAYNWRSMKEVVRDGRTGFLVNDIQEMKNAFRKLCLSGSLRKKMGECARVVADDFHTDTVLGKLFTKIKNDFKGY